VLSAPVSLVGGSFRLSPVIIDSGAATWQGAIAYDLKTLTLDARGTLAAKAAPERWTGALPSVGLAFRGPLGAPVREIDAAPLANGLAAIVLQRELEKIEAFEAEQHERQRRAQQQVLQRQKERERQIAEEAARQARLREEQEKAKAEAERVRAEAERIQAEQRAEQRARAEAERRAAQEAARQAAQEFQAPTPSSLPALPPPIDIRPAPQVGTRPGG
jgi:flagellar biosynthesis GTPase FlhF